MGQARKGMKALLVAALLTLVGFGTALWVVVGGGSTSNQMIRDEGRNPTDAGAGLGVPAESERTRRQELSLVGIEAHPTTPALGVDEAVGGRDEPLDAAGLAPPRRGMIRIGGTVKDQEGRAVVPRGAIVRISQRSRDLNSEVVLGEVGLSSGGRFRLDVSAADARARRGSFSCRFHAAGYEPVEQETDLGDEGDGVIDLSIEIEPMPTGVQVTGRLVNEAGEPVPWTTVYYGLWSPLRNAEQSEVETESDGRFTFLVEGGGWLTAFVSHPAHGVVTVTDDIEPSARLLDVGTWVLGGRSILAGEVVGPSGVPIPGLEVTASRRGHEDEESTMPLATDELGRFMFRSLPEGEYRLSMEYQDSPWNESPSFPTGTKGIRLVVARPTVHVSATDAAGRAALHDEISLYPVEPGSDRSDWTAGQERHPASLPASKDGLGFVLPLPGRYIASAYTNFDGALFSASRVLDVTAGHHVVDLVLEPVEGMLRTIRLEASDGAALAPWRVSFMNVQSGASLGSVSHRRPRIFLPYGEVTAYISPGEKSLAFPFAVELDLTLESPKDLVLVPPVVGGRVAVTFTADAGDASSASVTILEPSGDQVGGAERIFGAGKQRVLRRRLKPGPYVVVVRIAGAGDRPERRAEREVTVVSGGTVEVRLRLP